MPHLSIDVPEALLAGKENALIEAVTHAVVGVYGEWARELVGIRLLGVPADRWGQGGRTVDSAAHVTCGVRSSVFERPDADALTRRLAADITDAVVRVFGEQVRDAVMVELVASPAERTFVGGRNIA